MSTKISGDRPTQPLQPATSASPATVEAPKPKEAEAPKPKSGGLLDGLADQLAAGQRFIEGVGKSASQHAQQRVEGASKSVKELMGEGAKQLEGVKSEAQRLVEAKHAKLRHELVEVGSSVEALKHLGTQELERRADKVQDALSILLPDRLANLGERAGFDPAMGRQVSQLFSTGVEQAREALSKVDPSVLTEYATQTLKGLDEAVTIQSVGQAASTVAREGLQLLTDAAYAVKSGDEKLDLNRLLPESLRQNPYAPALTPLTILEMASGQTVRPKQLLETIIQQADAIHDLSKLADPSYHADQIRSLKPGEDHQLVLKGMLSASAGVGAGAQGQLQAQVSRDFFDKYEAKLVVSGAVAGKLGLSVQGQGADVSLTGGNQFTLTIQGQGDQAREALARLLTYPGDVSDLMADPFIQEHLSFKGVGQKLSLETDGKAVVLDAKGQVSAEQVTERTKDGQVEQLNLGFMTELSFGGPVQFSSSKNFSQVASDQLQTHPAGRMLSELGVLEQLNHPDLASIADQLLGGSIMPTGKLQLEGSLRLESSPKGELTVGFQTKATVEVGQHILEAQVELKAKNPEVLLRALELSPADLRALSAEDLIARCQQRGIKFEDHFEHTKHIKLMTTEGPGVHVMGYEGSSRTTRVTAALAQDSAGKIYTVGEPPKALRAGQLYMTSLRD